MDIPAGVCLLVADWGIGDHYLVGSFADAVRRQFGVKVWLAGRANLAFVADLYPAVEKFVDWPAGTDAQQLSAWKVEGGKVFYAHFPKMELMRAVGYNGFHFLDAYRCRLGLPVTANPTRPRLPNANETAAAAALLREHGLTPGNTVVLSVEARTTPTDGVDGNFWTALAGELEAAGLMTVVNAGPSTNVPYGLRSLSVPLPLFRAVVQSAGYFCSVRSGLSDLACDLRCPQVVVYPDVQYWGGTLIDGTTFGRYGLTKAPHEVVVREGYSSADVSGIVEYFAARRPKAVTAIPA
jgi:hypothetical protein